MEEHKFLELIILISSLKHIPCGVPQGSNTTHAVSHNGLTLEVQRQQNNQVHASQMLLMQQQQQQVQALIAFLSQIVDKEN